MVGSGSIGQQHIQAFLNTSRCSVSCVDVNSRNLHKIALRWPAIASLHSSLDDVQLKGLSGVVIAAPTNAHVKLMTWCIERRLPFLVEKPIAVSTDGVEAIVAETSRLGLIAGVAYPRRYGSATQELKKLVAGGSAGTLKLIHSSFCQDFRKYRPDYRSTYYAKLETGGGIVLDALSHHVDLLCYFAGPVSAVTAFYDRMVFEDCEGEDAALMLLRFARGMLGSINGNQFQKPNVDRLELVGTTGNVAYERVSGVLSWNNSDEPEWSTRKVDGTWSSYLAVQASSFLSALEGGERPLTTLEEGLHTLEVSLAARESQRSGTLQHLASK